MNLPLGYSPCPNDTFIFYALTHGRVSIPGITVSETLLDVETLNLRAMRSELDLTKVSFHALAYLRDDYCLLRSGAALGRGCGPVVVARKSMRMDELKGKRIAIPGKYTTAHLLLMLHGEGYENTLAMPFERVMPAVEKGEVEAGLVIHEGRFTYKNYDLTSVLDLGRWWEETTGLPIPLGCILAKRSLGTKIASSVESGIRSSIEYAFSHRDEARAYILAHAKEMDEKVVDAHINLYVNDFSKDLGYEGVRAVETLFELASSRGVIPRSNTPLFL